MTKRLACPIDDCGAVIEATNHDEIMSRVDAHAKEAHPGLVFDEGTFDTIASAVEDV